MEILCGCFYMMSTIRCLVSEDEVRDGSNFFVAILNEVKSLVVLFPPANTA